MNILCLFFALSLRGCPCHIAFTVIANGSGYTSLYIRVRHVSQKKKKKIKKLTWTSKTTSKGGKHSLPWQQLYCSNRGCAQCTNAFLSVLVIVCTSLNETCYPGKQNTFAQCIFLLGEMNLSFYKHHLEGVSENSWHFFHIKEYSGLYNRQRS